MPAAPWGAGIFYLVRKKLTSTMNLEKSENLLFSALICKNRWRSHAIFVGKTGLNYVSAFFIDTATKYGECNPRSRSGGSLIPCSKSRTKLDPRLRGDKVFFHHI
jgi:hypothetical protein